MAGWTIKHNYLENSTKKIKKKQGEIDDVSFFSTIDYKAQGITFYDVDIESASNNADALLCVHFFEFLCE